MIILRRLPGFGVLLLLAATFYALFIGRTAFRIDGQVHFTLIDDAMISMRYAQHLAAGDGLVWNIGESPVQGFSNPGWVLLMAGIHLFPISPAVISLAMMIVSAVMLIASVLVLASTCRDLAPESRLAPLIAAAIAAFYYPLVFWSLRGMEVGAIVLLITTATLLAFRLKRTSTREAIVLGLILAGAALIRLDAILQVVLIMLYAVTSRRPSPMQAALLIGIPLITVAGMLAFQQSYFGQLLPNTYYQKLADGSLFERIRAGFLAFYRYAARDVMMMSIIAAAGAWFYRSMRTRETALLGCLFLIQCVYSIWVGGDYAEPEVGAANRFITQGVPALIVLYALVIDRVISDLQRLNSRKSKISDVSAGPIAAGVAIATLAVISGAPWTDWAIDNAPLWKADVRRVRAGLAIAAATSEDATIAVHAAGQIPYYSDRRTIDLLGLNDPVIARGPRRTSFYPGHDKWNYEYSIGQLRPDLIADNWLRLGDYIKGNPDYRQLGNGIYILVETALVDEAALVRAYP